MPELPEVETTCRGISPLILEQTILNVVIRQPKLRFEIPPELAAFCIGQVIRSVRRRAKYLLLELDSGYLLNHLGMSGHLRVLPENAATQKHDHVDIQLSNGFILRYNDPRRFGFWLPIGENPEQHRLLSHLGPEPLSDQFNADYFYEKINNKKQAIKACLMNNEIVVGVGNIYATESLFLAGIHPLTPANSLTKAQLSTLAQHIKNILQAAIAAGGTTLRDFYASDGKPGYFSNKLYIYGRTKQPCLQCKTPIESVRIMGRASAFCPKCQSNS